MGGGGLININWHKFFNYNSLSVPTNIIPNHKGSTPRSHKSSVYNGSVSRNFILTYISNISQKK